MPGDLRMLAGENEVPPKGYFSLLDRPQPESAKGLTADTVPRIVGQVLVYGKQTDREARAELIANRRNLAASRAALEAIAGGHAGRGRRRRGCQPRPAPATTRWRWNGICRKTLPRPSGGSCCEAGHRQRLLVEWPEMPQRLLWRPDAAAGGGRSANADHAVGRDFEFGDGQRSVGRLRLQRIARRARLAAGRKDRSGRPFGAGAAAGSAGPAGRGQAGRRGLADRLRSGVAGAVHARDHAAGARARRPAQPRRRGRQGGGLCHAGSTGQRSRAGRQGSGRRPENRRGGGQIDRPLRSDRIGDSHGPGRYPPGRPAAQAHPDRSLARAGHRPGALLAVGPMGRHSSRRIARHRSCGRRRGIGRAGGRGRAEPASKIWTPGSEAAASGGKKPTIWTPGLD